MSAPSQVSFPVFQELSHHQPGGPELTTLFLWSSVNCEEYLAKDEKQIPVDEIFFYR